jgi:hypothetical protein
MLKCHSDAGFALGALCLLALPGCAAPSQGERTPAAVPPAAIAMTSAPGAKGQITDAHAAGQATAPADKPAAVAETGHKPPFFVIGAWYQPMSSFPKWKARGINTMMGFEAESIKVPFATWHDALAAQGLYAIRKPQGELAADAKDSRLLAWKFDDEPDLGDKRGKPGSDPASLQQLYAQYKAAAPQMPVYINLSGGDVRGAWQHGGAARAHSAAYSGAADWISQDLYPITGWARPDWIDLSLPVAMPAAKEPDRYTVGWTIDALRDLSEGKPQFAIIECSNQNLNWLPAAKRRGVSADEFRGQLWHAIIHGAVGIGYFPQQIGGGFKFDAMPDDVAAEMTAQDKKIAALSDILLAPGERLDTPAPIEVATRKLHGKTHTLVLNYSSKAADYRGKTYLPYEIEIS